jgi:hypothetical protein
MKRTALLLASTVLAVLLASGAVWADTFRVTNTKDPGTGSLRAAINEANARPDADAITFAPGVRGDSGLKKALPSLRGEVEIRGPGPSRLTVRRSAPEAFRVFSVAEGAAVTISGLKVSNGLALSSGLQTTGGGIHVELGALSVENCSFSTNRTPADVGGAISNEGVEVTVVGSTFSVNVARSYGGSLYKQFGHDSPSLVSVEGSTFANNSAARAGGGLYLQRFQQLFPPDDHRRRQRGTRKPRRLGSLL